MFSRLWLIAEAFRLINKYSGQIEAIKKRIESDPGAPENANLMEKVEHYGRLVADLMNIAFGPQVVGSSVGPTESLGEDEPVVVEFKALCERVEVAGQELSDVCPDDCDEDHEEEPVVPADNESVENGGPVSPVAKSQKKPKK